MKVSLQRLNKIQQGLSTLINEYRGKLDNMTPTSFDVMLSNYEQYQKATYNFESRVQIVERLIKTLYSIRAEQGKLNLSSGVHNILTQISEAEKLVDFYSSLLENARDYEYLTESQYNRRFALAKQACNDSINANLGRFNSLHSLMDEAGEEECTVNIRVLKKRLMELRDQLAEKNAATKITLSSSVEEVLAEFDLI